LAGDEDGGSETQNGTEGLYAWKVVASVAIVALVFFPLGLLVQRTPWSDLAASGGSRSTQATEPPHTGLADAFRNACTLKPRDKVSLQMYLDKLDIRDGLLTINVLACVGPALPVNLAQLGATLDGSILVGGERLPHGLPTQTNSPDFLGTVTVPADGDSRRYPLDTYTADVSPSIGTPALPDKLTSIEVYADPGVSDFGWKYSNNSSFLFLASATVEGRRPRSTDLFVLSLLAVPLVMIVLMLGQIVRKPPNSVEGLVGVAAIMLAILPIRAVLVPGDINAPTLVDLALAFEMALLAGGTALVYLWPRQTGAVLSWLGGRVTKRSVR
jgi:hypothetical protein